MIASRSLLFFLTPLALAGAAGGRLPLGPADASSACGFAAPSGYGSPAKAALGAGAPAFGCPRETGQKGRKTVTDETNI